MYNLSGGSYGSITAVKRLNEKRKVKRTPFLRNDIDKIVKHYAGILSICDYDPQKVGKAHQSYELALAGFKMAIAGII